MKEAKLKETYRRGYEEIRECVWKEVRMDHE